MKLAKGLYFLSIIILLFFGSNIRSNLGITGEGAFYRINPSLYALLLSLLFCILSHGNLYTRVNVEALPLGIFGFVIAIGKFITSVGGYLPVANNIFIPFLFCLLFPKHDSKFRHKCYKFLLFFFILECIWAIIERILLFRFFPFNDDGITNQADGFRSNALLGSPLTNSLCLTAILVCVLMSNMKRNYKVLLFITGYSAVLCFNTRTSIILWPVLFIVSLLYYAYKTEKRNSIFKILSIFIPVGSLFAYLILEYGLADRLFGRELMDNSANVRVDTWNMFLSVDLWNLLFSFGMESDDIESWMVFGGVEIIENSWVLYALELGGIGLTMVLLGYYMIFATIMKNYSAFIKIFSLGSFIILGSTNNGLKETSMSLFIICCYSIPMIEKHKNKYKTMYDEKNCF